MNNLLVYPFSHEDHYFLKYIEMLTEYSLKSLIVFENNCTDEWDNLRKNTNVAITDAFEEELLNCDSVLFLNTYYDDIPDIYQQKIRMAIGKQKEILICNQMYEDLSAEFKDYDKVKILDNIIDKVEYSKMSTEALGVLDIPVITVVSPGENCEKFTAQLEIKKAFERKGYKILQFGTKEYAGLFGMEVLPSFLKAEDLSLSKKTDMFNFYINKMVLHSDYDAVVIGIPGGFLPIDKMHHNYYGEISVVVSYAFDIDINVVCSYHNPELTSDEVRNICSFMQHKLGCVTEYFFSGNTQFRLIESGLLEYVRLNYQFCQDTLPKIEDSEIKYCHIVEEDKMEHFFDEMVSELEDNISIV